MAKAGYFKADSVRIVKRRYVTVFFRQFEKSRMSEIDIFWFSQYSTMGPLEAILTPKRSQTQAEPHCKVFLVWFYIGPQSIMRAEVGRDTFSDLDDTLGIGSSLYLVWSSQQ